MIVILNYHSISDRDYTYSTSPQIFEKQMLYLKKMAKIITIEKLEEILKNTELPKELLAVVTFDDGLKDNFTEAFPILKKHRIPFTVFMSTDFIGKSVTNKKNIFSFLSWEDIKIMDESGLVSFESHTHSHPIVPLIEKDDQIKFELTESKNTLESKLQKKVKYFAYPKGKYDTRTTSIISNYFSLAFAENGIVSSKKDINLYAIPRVVVRAGDSFLKFRLWLFPLYWKLKSYKYNV